MQAASGVHEHDVGALRNTGCDRIEGDGGRVRALLATHGGGADTPAPRLQLVRRRGAEGVGRAEDNGVAHGHQHAGELARGGGLAGTVDTDHKDHCRFAVVRHGLDGAVEIGAGGLNEGFAQHRARLFLRLHSALGDLLAQGFGDFHGQVCAQIRHDQRVLDLLPGVLIKVTGGEDAQQTLADRVLRAGQATAQFANASSGRLDLVQRLLGRGLDNDGVVRDRRPGLAGFFGAFRGGCSSGRRFFCLCLLRSGLLTCGILRNGLYLDRCAFCWLSRFSRLGDVLRHRQLLFLRLQLLVSRGWGRLGLLDGFHRLCHRFGLRFLLGGCVLRLGLSSSLSGGRGGRRRRRPLASNWLGLLRLGVHLREVEAAFRLVVARLLLLGELLRLLGFFKRDGLRRFALVSGDDDAGNDQRDDDDRNDNP